MAEVKFRVDSQGIRNAVKRKVTDPIVALTRSPEIREQIAKYAESIVRPYVPMKTGDLRNSFHIVSDSRSTHLVWGSPSVGKTNVYASIQYYADDSFWNRTTPGTMSYWTTMIERGSPGFDELTDYASTIMKRNIKNG